MNTETVDLQSRPSPVIPISYGQAEFPAGARVWAAFAILFGGLGLMVVGGCFLIGVLFELNSGFNAVIKPRTSADDLFLAILYILAFCSFLAGIWVISIGVRGLLRVICG